MKKIPILNFIFLLIGFGFLSCNPEQVPNNIVCLPSNLQKGVIAYYPFSKGSLQDRSGFNHSLFNNSTASSAPDRAGSPGCAFQFDNSADTIEFLTTTNTVFLNGLSSFSISLWYEPMDTTRGQTLFGYEVLVGRGQGKKCPDRVGIWSLGLYDGRRAVFGFNNGVWANSLSKLPSGSDEFILQTNEWHHVVAVYNKGNNKLYFNGILNEIDSVDVDCGKNNFPLDIGDLFIGKYYTGIIDDILIYNRELSQNEVSQLYNLPPCCD